MLNSRSRTFSVLALILAGTLNWRCATDAGGEQDSRVAPLLDGMGEHHHAITTDVEMAQRFFNQGLVLSYGFNHKEAERAFREAARLDPNCAMAYWGIALVLGPNINAGMEDEAVPMAHSALQKALELADKVSEKERDFIRALAKRYAAKPVADRTQLDVAYADAMRNLARNYPGDNDAVTLYAEALMDLHPWNFWKKDGEPQSWTPEIVTTLESVLQAWPDHPGANHLYIHLVEASPNPGRALPSADRLRDLVPGAGHLVHMPSHIYIRTGMYHEGSLANERAIAADDAYITQCRSQGIYPLAYHPHNYHFLWATATMEGRSHRAIEAARTLASKVDENMMRQAGYGTLQHFYAIPLYALTKFWKWDDILAEPAPPEDLLYPTGVWHFARGMAFANKNHLDEARRQLGLLGEIAADTSLLQVTIWDINTMFALMQIAREVLSGEIAVRQDEYEKAISHLKKAVRLEDDLNYDEPYPWYSPARHALGGAFLRANRPVDAERAYKEDLVRYPDNGWSLFGLVESMVAQGKTEQAEILKKQFDKAWVRADVMPRANLKIDKS